MTKPPVIYVVEVEHLPGKWRPVGLPPKARVRVGRYTFDGLTHGRRPRS